MDVYRKGTKSVHVGWVRAPGVKVAQVDECNLDSGGGWGPVEPVGSRCEACFGAPTHVARRSGPGRSKAAFAGTAAALALAAAVFGSSLGEPVNILIPASGDVTSTPFASVTPGPSVVPPGPTEAPALTPGPTDAVPTLQPAPQPLPTWPPPPSWPPLPTIVLPTLPPLPVPDICARPGRHLGLTLCKWGNR